MERGGTYVVSIVGARYGPRCLDEADGSRWTVWYAFVEETVCAVLGWTGIQRHCTDQVALSTWRSSLSSSHDADQMSSRGHVESFLARSVHTVWHKAAAQRVLHVGSQGCPRRRFQRMPPDMFPSAEWIRIGHLPFIFLSYTLSSCSANKLPYLNG